LANIADVDKVAPFQPWARDLFALRQRNRLADDPQYLYCLPPGGPRQFQGAMGVQFIEDKEHQRIFVFVGSVDRNWRLIYLDGRQQVGQVRGDADNPLYYGRSVGKWEGDALVVDTKGFNEKFWFSNGGLPHTDKLHLIEKFTRTDTNTLKYEVTSTILVRIHARGRVAGICSGLPTKNCRSSSARTIGHNFRGFFRRANMCESRGAQGRRPAESKE